jgi:hypothetical protein
VGQGENLWAQVRDAAQKALQVDRLVLQVHPDAKDMADSRRLLGRHRTAMGGWVGRDEVLGAGCLESYLGQALDCRSASVGGPEEPAGHRARLEQRQRVAQRKAVFRVFAPAAAAARDAVLALLVLVLALPLARLQAQQDEWVSRLVGAAEQPVLVVAVQSQGPVAPLRQARKVQAREPVQAWVDGLVVPPTVQDELLLGERRPA